MGSGIEVIDMKIVILNVFLSLILFFLNGLLGRLQYNNSGNLFEYGRFSFSINGSENFSGNFFLKVFIPTIYTSILCAVFQVIGHEEICHSLWLIAPIFWGIRILFIFVRDFFEIINWQYEFYAAIASLLLCEGTLFFIIYPLIDSGISVFIPLDEIRNAVWFAILAYIVKILWNISKTHLDGQALYPVEKQQAVIYSRYDKFSKKYGDYIRILVDESYPDSLPNKGNFICLIYAIMILEDYNRPKVCRIVEYILKFLLARTEMTLGIMQVKTKSIIFDLESIHLAVSKLLAVYTQNFYDNPIEHAIRDYNGSSQYLSDAVSIYNELLYFNSIDSLITDNESYRV
mgnify:CR=1 FL=1